MPPVLEERRSSLTELDSSHLPPGRREGWFLDVVLNVSLLHTVHILQQTLVVRHLAN